MVIIKKDIIYNIQHSLKTDIYFPNNTTSKTKILVFWHGGGWFKGSKDDFKDLGVNLANAGFMTIIPNYRLAPTYHFPAAHHDSLAFINWLLKSDYTDEDDLNNIVQIGASAGGTLALYIAGRYGFPTVTWSAPVEFSHWLQAHSQTDAKIDSSFESFYKFFTLTYLGKNNLSQSNQLDAKNYYYNHLGPLKMINSANELVELDTALDFIKFLAKHNHEVDFLAIPGKQHAMSYAKNYLKPTIDFLIKNKRG